MFYHFKIGLSIACVKVVKEDSANSPHFIATMEINKIFITLFFHIFITSERCTGLFPNTVKVMKVLFIGIIGSEVCSSSKPKLISLLDHAKVSMNRRNTWVNGMNDERNSSGPHLI